MELYILGANFNPTDLVEDYGSVIWTERFGDSGDVTLVVPDTATNRTRFADGAYLGSDETDQVMVLDTADIKNGEIKLTGNTLDKQVFENRLILHADPITDATERWLSDNHAGAFLEEVLTYFATPAGWTTWANAYFASDTTPQGIDMPKQMLSNLVFAEAATSLSSLYSIQNRQTIYDLIKNVAAVAKIGWRLVPASITPTSHQLAWYTWDKGNSDVRFSALQDTLTDVSELRSKRDYKTVAYAISPDFDPTDRITGGVEYTGVAYAYSGADVETGPNRRVIIVEKTGLTDEAVGDNQTKYNNIMNSAAADALANNNFVKVIDGEVVPQNQYKFGVDYRLGSLVELEDPHGTIQTAVITEYIRSSDANGFRAYPTVSVED